MEPVVISLGGSIVAPDGLNIEFIERFCNKMKIMDSSRKYGIVVGGGSLARSYISSLRPRGVNDNILDEIGINATRMNALSISAFLEDSNYKIPQTVNDAAELSRIYRFTVMGGTEPGHTTDTVATLLAERIGSRILINATSVDGVYSSDPRKDRSARKFSSLTYDEAIGLALKESVGAGPNVFMDLTALNIAKRSRIRIFVINGKDLDEYDRVIHSGRTNGTMIA
ncbi:MAG TPA: UMP kinase [Thermoplasmataceae archaeon]|nr:UMP kinase [Thermoplasmataceae archaeon]